MPEVPRRTRFGRHRLHRGPSTRHAPLSKVHRSHHSVLEHFCICKNQRRCVHTAESARRVEQLPQNCLFHLNFVAKLIDQIPGLLMLYCTLFNCCYVDIWVGTRRCAEEFVRGRLTPRGLITNLCYGKAGQHILWDRFCSHCSQLDPGPRWEW